MFGAETIRPKHFVEISVNSGLYVGSAIFNTIFKALHGGLAEPNRFSFKPADRNSFAFPVCYGQTHLEDNFFKDRVFRKSIKIQGERDAECTLGADKTELCFSSWECQEICDEPIFSCFSINGCLVVHGIASIRTIASRENKTCGRLELMFNS